MESRTNSSQQSSFFSFFTFWFVQDLHHRIRTLEQDKVNLSNILRDVLWLQTYQGTGVNADIVHDHLNQIKAKYSLYNEHSVSNNPSSSSVSALCQAADDIRKKIEAHDCSVQSNGRHQESTFAERIASKVGRSSAWKSLSVEQENERVRALLTSAVCLFSYFKYLVDPLAATQ